ncbi:MAG: hypothetical protein AAGE52_33865 [Myxococcota bacterium]
MTTAVALIALSLVDHAFAGYRAAAGRDGRIDKTRFYRRAVIFGAVQGAGVAAALAGLAGALLLTSAPEAVFADMTIAGRSMVFFFGGYATLVFATFVPYLAGTLEIRTLATVTVFGPLTLLRPVLIIVGSAFAIAHADLWQTYVLAVVAGLAHIGSESVLDRWIPSFAFRE